MATALAPVLAHAGHWLESAAFVLPPVLLVAMVLGAAVHARRQEQRRDDEREASR